MQRADPTTLSALRNFFLARTGDDLAAACEVLAKNGAASGGSPELADVDWQQAEFIFNRLFVGPMSLEAPPYSSYYLAPEPQLMGPSTLQVRRLYEMAGLASPLQGHLPDDHLGVELDAAAGILSLAERADAQEPRALWGFFLNEHLLAWVPQFLDQARNARSKHPVVNLALDRLGEWLEDQRTQQEGSNR